MEIRGWRERIVTGTSRLRTAGALAVMGLALLLSTVFAAAPVEVARATESAAVSRSVGHAGGADPASVDRGRDGGEPELEMLASRVERVKAAWGAASDYYESEVAPIERVLWRYGGDPDLSRHIAVALVREANNVGLEPRLLLAVLLVENPWLDPDIRSPVGAIGLMQIMPVHRGGWSMCGPDLENVDHNICHGANIFAHYFRSSGGNVERALLRYNGCVSGTNTPNCHQYPTHVFARAGQASVLAWLDQAPGAASP